MSESHDHHHEHGGPSHGHDHGHSHAPPGRMNLAFGVGMLLNVVFVVIGIIAGVAMTAHLVAPWERCSPRMLADVAKHMAHEFKIGHCTIQLESVAHGNDCEQAPIGAV